jgi:intracellular sulfur oxidation DsrE/DsrF family protein
MRFAITTMALLGFGLAGAATAQVADKTFCWVDGPCVAPQKVEAGAASAQAVPPRPTRAAAARVEGTGKVAIQVSQKDAAAMTGALSAAQSLIQNSKAGKKVEIEIVTFGPGLHMLRADTSPVKEQIASMAREHPNVRFLACANTQANQSRAEGKPVELLKQAAVTPSGVVRLIELQERGYAYVRP